MKRVIAGDPGRDSAEAVDALPETDRRHAIAERAGRKQAVDVQPGLNVLRVGEVSAQVVVELVPGKARLIDRGRAQNPRVRQHRLAREGGDVHRVGQVGRRGLLEVIGPTEAAEPA